MNLRSQTADVEGFKLEARLVLREILAPVVVDISYHLVDEEGLAYVDDQSLMRRLHCTQQ